MEAQSKERTFNNPKEEATPAATVMHLKSGDNRKGQSMEDHLWEDMGITMELVSTECI